MSLNPSPAAVPAGIDDMNLYASTLCVDNGLVAADPRVLTLDLASGYAAREVYGTARPTATGRWVDGAASPA